MSKRWVSVWLFSVLALPGGALAQGWPVPPPMPGAPLHAKKVLRGIGLSEEQIKRIETLHFEADRQRIDIHHEIEKARLAMRQLLSVEKPDEAAVFAQIEKIGALDVQLKKNRMGLLLKVRALMTPQQWEKFQAASPRHRFRFRHRGPGPFGRGHFPHPTPPPEPTRPPHPPEPPEAP